MEATDTRKRELMDAIKKGIAEAVGIIKKVMDELMESANLLRVEHTDKVFTAFSEQVRNLSYLMDFITELKKGMEHLKELNVPTELLSCWDRSPEIFKEMISAFERKDWIALSDLIQYELYPLLEEGEKGLSDLSEMLSLQKI